MHTERVEHQVPEDQQTCPHCGSSELNPLGTGRETVTFDYVPGYFIRRMHVQQTLACSCGQHVVTAEPPPKVFDKSRYEPGFMAHLVVAKCGDSMPIYRLEKQYKRLGIPMARSTMTDLFHRAAELLAPLHVRMLERIAASDVVLADETPIKVQKRKKKGYMWAFLGDDLVAYRFSPDRSGRTPLEVLGGETGTLVVDAYSGYNAVTDVDGWDRAACLAHVRRKFFEALTTAPEAQRALDLILEVYRVEHDATALGIARTNKHLEMRKERSAPVMRRLHGWLAEQQGLHPPKSPIGLAIAHAQGNWKRLNRFLEDARVPVDNNGSERALRPVALGRKNFLFVGHDRAGDNVATLYSLVASCERHEVNPVEYLTDVLMRIQFHPASQIDDLLPNRWTAIS